MELIVALSALALLAWLFLRPPPSRKRDPALPDPAQLGLPGSTPARAIEVPSPAVIESQASEDPCLACGARLHCEHHRVEVHDGQRVRVAELACRRCGFERAIYFVLRPSIGPH